MVVEGLPQINLSIKINFLKISLEETYRILSQ